MKIARHQYLVLIIGLVVTACSQSPTAPETAKVVTIIGPVSGVLGVQDTFLASLNFTTASPLLYAWTIDDSTFRTGSPEVRSMIQWKFKTLGRHAIKVQVFQADSRVMVCEGLDTFTVFPNQLLISPDSLECSAMTLVNFRASLKTGVFPTHFTMLWVIDSQRLTVTDRDTISYQFVSPGLHSVVVALVDSLDKSAPGAATISVSPIKIKINSSALATPVRTQISFSVLNPFMRNTILHLDYGDGISIDSSVIATSHFYSFLGAFMVRAKLMYQSQIIGEDSVLVTQVPSIVGFDPSVISTYHVGVAKFSGSLTRSAMTYCDAVNTTFVADSLSWSSHSFSRSHHSSTTSSSGSICDRSVQTNGSYLNAIGNISLDGLKLDSMACNEGSSYSLNHTGSHFYSSSQSSNSGITCRSLPLIWATPDSIQFGIRGTSLNRYISFSSGCDDHHAPNGWDESSSVIVDWSQVASATVTFHK